MTFYINVMRITVSRGEWESYVVQKHLIFPDHFANTSLNRDGVTNLDQLQS